MLFRDYKHPYQQGYLVKHLSVVVHVDPAARLLTLTHDGPVPVVTTETQAVAS